MEMTACFERTRFRVGSRVLKRDATLLLNCEKKNLYFIHDKSDDVTMQQTLANRRLSFSIVGKQVVITVAYVLLTFAFLFRNASVANVDVRTLD